MSGNHNLLFEVKEITMNMNGKLNAVTSPAMLSFLLSLNVSALAFNDYYKK